MLLLCAFIELGWGWVRVRGVHGGSVALFSPSLTIAVAVQGVSER